MRVSTVVDLPVSGFLFSDAHEGLVKALPKTFPGCEWQRCQVQFKRNVLGKVRIKDLRRIKEQLNHVFGASGRGRH